MAPFLVVFGSSLPSSTEKTFSDKTFWICAWYCRQGIYESMVFVAYAFYAVTVSYLSTLIFIPRFVMQGLPSVIMILEYFIYSP